MLAKLKVFSIILVLAPSFTWAETDAASKCETLSGLSSDFISKSLTSFSKDVLGKPTDFWTYDDFVNLQKNAIACDGYPPNVDSDGQVNAREWQSDLIYASREVLLYSAITKSIHEAYKPHWRWSELPSCIAIVDWKRDPIWFTDNSADIFGKDLRALKQNERVMAGGFAEACLPVMEKVLDNNGHDKSSAKAIVEDIKKSIEREKEADREDPIKLAESLHVYKDGLRIPLAYLGPTARKWVEFANKYELKGMTMRTEELITISKWIDLSENNAKEDTPDTLYAKAMRRVVSKRMFGRE